MTTNRYLGVDPVLTSVAIAYQNDAYIAEMLLPTFPVAKQSGKHFIYDKGRFRNPVNSGKRAQSANSADVTLNLTTGLPYFCEDHALKQFVSDDDVDNAITPTDPYQDATENVSEMHLVAREIECATMLTDTAQLTQNTTLSGTSQWSDFTNSDPIGDVDTGKATIHAATGLNPNVLVLGKQVFDKLKRHTKILDLIKYSQKGILTAELLAEAFGVDRVIIGGALKTTSAEGQTDATSYIWGKHAVLAYVAPRVAPKMITLGLTYQFKAKQTERLRGSDEEDRKGTYVRVGNHYYDQNIVALSCGYLIKNAIA